MQNLESLPRFARTDFPTSDLMARIRELEHENQTLRARLDTPAPAPRPRHSKVVLDTRTAAECWLAGDRVIRPSKAQYKKGRAQSVRVDFADGESLRLSTYLDGPEGIADATRTARALRQAPKLTRSEIAPEVTFIAQAAGCHVHYAGDGFVAAGNGFVPGGQYVSDAQSSEHAAIRDFCDKNGLDYAAAVATGRTAWAGRMSLAGPDPQWVRDTKGAWRLVNIVPCPAVLAADFVDGE